MSVALYFFSRPTGCPILGQKEHCHQPSVSTLIRHTLWTLTFALLSFLFHLQKFNPRVLTRFSSPSIPVKWGSIAYSAFREVHFCFCSSTRVSLPSRVVILIPASERKEWVILTHKIGTTHGKSNGFLFTCWIMGLQNILMFNQAWNGLYMIYLSFLTPHYH